MLVGSDTAVIQLCPTSLVVRRPTSPHLSRDEVNRSAEEPVPRPVPSVPIDVSEVDNESGYDGCTNSFYQTKDLGYSHQSLELSAFQRLSATEQHAKHVLHSIRCVEPSMSPLTELIRAFEMLKQSPFLADTGISGVEDDNGSVEFGNDETQREIGPTPQPEELKCARKDYVQGPQPNKKAPSFVRRRHSECPLKRDVIVASANVRQRDQTFIRSASWEKNFIPGIMRPRALTVSFSQFDDAIWHRGGSTENRSLKISDEKQDQTPPSLLCSKNGVVARQLEGFRARRPASLRINTSTINQTPRLPQRGRKQGSGTCQPGRSMSQPTLWALRQNEQTLSSVTSEERVALHSGAKIGLTPDLYAHTALVPSSCVFPTSLPSHCNDDADLQPPTTAELRAAVSPYPLDFVPTRAANQQSNSDSHEVMQHMPPVHTQPRRDLNDLGHSPQPAENAVHAWALITHNSMQSGTKFQCDASARRTAPLQVKTTSHIHFDTHVEVAEAEKGTLLSACGSSTAYTRSDNDEDDDNGDDRSLNIIQQGSDKHDVVDSPAYGDAFIFERDLSPSRAGCVDAPLHCNRSKTFASVSSTSESGEVLTAPPVGGRVWHRGRRNAMCVFDTVAPLSSRRAPTSDLPTYASLQNPSFGQACIRKKESDGKRRHFSASFVTTFASTVASWSRTSGTYKRKPPHPCRSPYPGSTAAVCSTTACEESAGVFMDDAMPSPHRRRPSTARGQRDGTSRIASMPATKLRSKASLDSDRCDTSSLRRYSAILTLPKRTSAITARSSSLKGSFSSFNGKDTQHDSQMVQPRQPRLPQRKRTSKTQTTNRVPSIGLGLQYDAKRNSCERTLNEQGRIPFPPSAPLCVADDGIDQQAHGRRGLFDVSSSALTSRYDAVSPMLASSMSTML